MWRFVVVIGAIPVSMGVAIPEALYGQSGDPAATKLGLTRETGSLPIWASPDLVDIARLSESSRSIRRAVFLVGTADAGHGTAFTVSQKHRLLATNAHVADMLHKAGKMLAILNETNTIYQVERIWYHPGVLRIFDRSRLAVFRSSNPADGNVFAQSADVALLQLKEGGPPLPGELKLAAPEAMADVFAQPIAVLGFPGHDTKAWPGLGETARSMKERASGANSLDVFPRARG